MRFDSGTIQVAKETLIKILGDVRSSRASYLYRDEVEPNVFLLEQWWEAQDDLERHMRTSAYLNTTIVMEMSLEVPVIATYKDVLEFIIDLNGAFAGKMLLTRGNGEAKGSLPLLCLTKRSRGKR